MKSLKARKELKFIALISILFGVVIIFVCCFSIFWLNEKTHVFSSISKDEYVQAIILDLLLAIKTLNRILLVCSFLIISLGWCSLRYLKMENKGSQIKSDSSNSVTS